MITIKNPVRLACIIACTATYFILGDTQLGIAFLLGTFTGSFSFEPRKPSP